MVIRVPNALGIRYSRSRPGHDPMGIYASNVSVIAGRVGFRAGVIRRGLIGSVGVPFKVQASILAAHVSGGEHQIRSELSLDFNIPLLRVGILVSGSDKKLPEVHGVAAGSEFAKVPWIWSIVFSWVGLRLFPLKSPVRARAPGHTAFSRTCCAALPLPARVSQSSPHPPRMPVF